MDSICYLLNNILENNFNNDIEQENQNDSNNDGITNLSTKEIAKHFMAWSFSKVFFKIDIHSYESTSDKQLDDLVNEIDTSDKLKLNDKSNKMIRNIVGFYERNSLQIEIFKDGLLWVVQFPKLLQWLEISRHVKDSFKEKLDISDSMSKWDSLMKYSKAIISLIKVEQEVGSSKYNLSLFIKFILHILRIVRTWAVFTINVFFLI